MKKVHKGKVTLFAIIVVAILTTTATTLLPIWNQITKGLDLQGGFEILYQAAPGQNINTQTLEDAASAIRNRIDILGVREPEITVEQPNRIRVQLAGVKDQQQAREVIGKPAQLTFRDPTGKKILIQGSDLKPGGAKVGYDQANQPIVEIEVKNAQKLADVTKTYVGQTMPIYLDEQQLSAPVIKEPIIGGKAMIDGQESVEEAQELVDLLNAGALPIKLEEVQSHAVDASLGNQSLMDSLVAGTYAILAIFLFMIGYYRIPGFIATITLVAYTYLVLVVFALLDITLTLAGIAAFILGIGMAVDANIIMNERIRDELRNGRSVRAAVKTGSKRSLITISDANLTTVIAAIVLFYFGSAGVKGFSVSLIAGIAVSFVTAVALSRWLLNLLVKSYLIQTPEAFRVKEDEINDL